MYVYCMYMYTLTVIIQIVLPYAQLVNSVGLLVLFVKCIVFFMFCSGKYAVFPMKMHMYMYTCMHMLLNMYVYIHCVYVCVSVFAPLNIETCTHWNRPVEYMDMYMYIIICNVVVTCCGRL